MSVRPGDVALFFSGLFLVIAGSSAAVGTFEAAAGRRVAAFAGWCGAGGWVLIAIAVIAAAARWYDDDNDGGFP